MFPHSLDDSSFPSSSLMAIREGQCPGAAKPQPWTWHLTSPNPSSHCGLGPPPRPGHQESLTSCENLLAQRRFFQNDIRFPLSPARQREPLLPNMVEECLRNWCDSVWLQLRFSTQTPSVWKHQHATPRAPTPAPHLLTSLVSRPHWTKPHDDVRSTK